MEAGSFSLVAHNQLVQSNVKQSGIHTKKGCDNLFHVLQETAEMMSDGELRRCNLSYYCCRLCMGSLGMGIVRKDIS